jgi:uncharacterized membrane protein
VSEPTSAKLEGRLAAVMLWGVLLAAVIMFLGGVIHLVQNPGAPVADHVFRGEPRELRDPAAMVRAAWEGSDPAFIQVGVLLLLLNPLLRVLLSLGSYVAARNWKYVVISLVLTGVLIYSLLA